MGLFARLFGPGDGLPPSKSASKDHSVIESADLSGCIRIYTSSLAGSFEEQQATDKIKKIARSFQDWLRVSREVSPVSTLGTFALGQLPLMAQSFGDWHEVFSVSSAESARTLAVEKMASMAHGREEQLTVYGLAPEGPIKEAMLQSLKSQAKTISDWRSIFESTTGDIGRFAGGMVIDLTEGNVSALSDLLSDSDLCSDPALKDKIWQRIHVLAASPDDWIALINDDDTADEVRIYAIESVIGHSSVIAKGFGEWERILKRTEDDSDFEKRVAEKVVETAPLDDPEILEGLLGYEVISQSDDLRKSLIEKLKAVPGHHFDSWKDLYESTEEDDVKDICREKMISGADSLERLKEVESAIDADDRDSDFDEKFGARIREVVVSEADCRPIVEGYTAESVLFAAAFERLLDLSSSTQQCFDLFLSILNDWTDSDGNQQEDLVEKAIDRLLAVATPGEKYIMSKLGNDFGDLGSRAEAALPDSES